MSDLTKEQAIENLKKYLDFMLDEARRNNIRDITMDRERLLDKDRNLFEEWPPKDIGERIVITILY
jgi:hypothetical protein